MVFSERRNNTRVTGGNHSADPSEVSSRLAYLSTPLYSVPVLVEESDWSTIWDGCRESAKLWAEKPEHREN